TSSKAREYLVSRSRIRNGKDADWSSNEHMRFRACWETHAESGWAVTPAMCTRRVWTSMKKSTYSLRSQSVSTVKKSQARMPWAWALRNCDHVGPDRRGA